MAERYLLVYFTVILDESTYRRVPKIITFAMYSSSVLLMNFQNRLPMDNSYDNGF